MINEAQFHFDKGWLTIKKLGDDRKVNCNVTVNYVDGVQTQCSKFMEPTNDNSSKADGRAG